MKIKEILLIVVCRRIYPLSGSIPCFIFADLASMNQAAFKKFLDQKAAQYNNPLFIGSDPIFVPHQFEKLQDREIAGFFAAILAWGHRKIILKNALHLTALMDGSPHDFILHHEEKDLKRFLHFRHRTFNATDLLYCIYFFREYYTLHDSLETAFSSHLRPGDETVENALAGFRNTFFAHEHPQRSEKHISNPAKNSACKRLNMFLRWMVRHDEQGVDFGIWKSIAPSQLVCPLDIHVSRVAKRFGLLQSDQVSWKAAVSLTDELRIFDAGDPVKYDFALFGLGVEERFV